MKLKAISFFIFFIAANCFAQKSVEDLLLKHNSQSIPYISVEELRMLQLNETLTILDTREAIEFETSHIASSINIGFNNFSSEDKRLQNINKNAVVVVYCSLGVRSEEIGEKLKKEGFSNVKNLYGGIFEWKNKGFPVFDISEKETENIHAFSKQWSEYIEAGNPVY